MQDSFNIILRLNNILLKYFHILLELHNLHVVYIMAEINNLAFNILTLDRLLYNVKTKRKY